MPLDLNPVGSQEQCTITGILRSLWPFIYLILLAAACGTKPHGDTCLLKQWLKAGCSAKGTHAPPNGPSQIWRRQGLSKVLRLMRVYKKKAMQGLRNDNGAQYVTLCTGKQGANCGPDSSRGPHTEECLVQMWRDVGCFDTGTFSPINSPSAKKWNGLTVRQLRKRMASYKMKALKWDVHKKLGPYVMLCFGSGISSNKDNPILGGSNVYDPGRWPWLATLYAGDTFCTAAIIHPQWLMTAGHCVEGKMANETYVKLGVVDISSNGPTPVKVDAKRLILHDDYESSDDPFKLVHDVALVELTENVTFGPTIKPIGLPQVGGAPYTNCYMTGWGNFVNNGSISAILQQLRAVLCPDSYCSSLLGSPNWFSTGGIRCAHGHHQGKICPGDSGGPLNCKQGHDHYVAFGTASWSGRGCSSMIGYGEIEEKVAWIRQTCNDCA